MAITAVDTKFQRFDGSEWEDIAEVKSIIGPSFLKDVINVTSLDTDTNYNEFITGFMEGGTVSFVMIFSRDYFELLKQDFEDVESGYYAIELPDTTIMKFYGILIKLEVVSLMDEEIKTNVAIKLIGEPELTYSELDDACFVDGDEFDNGKVIIQWDDGYDDNYSLAFPLHVAKNVPGTFFVKTSFIGGASAMTWAQLLEMSNAGMDIESHTQTFGVLIDSPDEDIISDLLAENDDFVNNGLSAPEHIAYPGGYIDDRVANVIDELRKTGRTGVPTVMTRKGSWYFMPCASLKADINALKAAMDYVKANKMAYCIYGHRISTTSDEGLFVLYSQVEAVMDYGLSIGLDFITTRDLYELFFYIDIRLAVPAASSSGDNVDDEIDIICKNKLPSDYSISIERSNDDGVTYNEIGTLSPGETDYHDTGLTLSKNYYYRARGFKDIVYLPYSRETCLSTLITFQLTATGDGSGVASLSFTPDQNTTLTVDGDARFYTDSGGTLGETTTITTRYQQTNTVYIRLSSGTANLTFSRNNILEINSWSSTSNAPSISGDISVFGRLEFIDMQGQNTISGDISKLYNLEYIRVQGSNTLSGDISNLINLETLYVLGSNTLSGDISGLVNLTYIRVGSGCSLTGSITNLVNLTYLSIQSSNTLSGDISGLVNLTAVNIGGGNTLTGSLTLLTNLEIVYLLSSNTLSGDISDKTSLIQFRLQGLNTITGDFGLNNVVDGLTMLVVTASQLTEYTSGGTWGNINVTLSPGTSGGYNQASIGNILIDMDNSPVGPSSKTISLLGNNASMSDTSQGGIWGTFDGSVPEPSDLAVALKSMRLTRLNTVSLNGISYPSTSGDGSGFPVGFGDWWRSSE